MHRMTSKKTKGKQQANKEDDLPSPPEEDEEQDENRQNADDRRIEMNEEMKRTRYDAEPQETGSEVELSLTPVGSIRSED